MPSVNPTGKHRRKRRRHGEGTVVQRKPYRLADGTLRKRTNPWAAVVPYRDASGRRKEMWLSAASRPEAEAILAAELARIAKQLTPSHLTVAEYVNEWLSTVGVGPGTFPTYRGHVTERIIPTIGTVPLDELTPYVVRTALLAWEGAPATRAGTLRLLRAAMKQAMADRLIEHDPTAGIPYPRIARTQPTTLTGEQARHLIETVKGERFAPVLVFSLGMGVRRGEALGLRTVDLDLDAGTVRIAKGLRYIAPDLRAEGEGPYRLTGTKTGESRTLPMPAFVIRSLRERLEERDTERRAAKVWAPNDFVFCDPVGNSIPIQTLYAWYKGALKRAKLPDCRWHDLRGSCLTLLFDMGVPDSIVMAVAGHKELETTLLYKGATPRAMGSAADRIEEGFG